MPYMKLLNFSVGQVKTIQISGRSVQTAHVKEPAAEPWVITADGAQGDQRAVHPDKIYAFARSGYEYWGSYLGMDPTRWPDGFFGENLTLDVLDEAELRVGDIFEMGDEVRLVVAGPRNPCQKLSWRLGQPLTFQKVFAQSGHTGVYFGVLRTGTVRPGDTMHRVLHDSTMPSLVDVANFAAGHSTPPLVPLKRLLDFENLSLTIRFILSAKLDAAERAAAAAEGRWRGWRGFVIEQIVEEAPEIRSFHLRPVDGDLLCRPRPGQFVAVRLPGEGGETITRTWSLSSYAHQPSSYRLTVRRQTGPGSNWLHRAGVGAKVELRAPAGDFVLDAGGFRPVVLVAAGIGVTPVLAMLHAHVARGPNAPPVYLIYGARTPRDMAFRGELDAIAAAHPSLRITYVFSQSDTDGRRATRITPDLLIELLGDLYIKLGERRVALPWFESDIYICGPGDFCRTIKTELTARGANADHLFTELFSELQRESSGLQAAEIRFRKSGLSCTWRAEQDLSLLELAEKTGISIESDCRAGSCLTCKTKVVEGSTTTETGDGCALLCIGRPKTAVLILDC
jgi:ferredoxin-NADP reductase/MOSC domain-containing protein YiiM